MAKNKNFDPGTKMVDERRKMTEVEKIRYVTVQQEITKLCIHQKKVLAVFITFDVKGVFEIYQFGAASEISKRSQFLAEKIRDAIPGIMESYDIPKKVDNDAKT